MAGRGLPDLRPSTDAELIAAWRRRADELESIATDLEIYGEPGAIDCRKAAAEYRTDADKLEYGERG